ncbi:YkuS family protein [Bacillaceae bacterium]
MARIGVEKTLGNVQRLLQNSGHQVVSLEAGNMADCDCYVISGQDKNMLGISDRVTGASVINAEGMTAEEVLREVNERTRLR